MAENKNRIDIIIPTYRPGEKFRRLLEMLKKQKLPVHKLIIINTVPDDDVNASSAQSVLSVIREYFPGDECIFKNIRQNEFDHAGTRKYAASLSDADVFICMTDDAVPADEYLTEKLTEALNRDERIATAYARQLPDKTAGEAERYVRSFNYPEKSMIKGRGDIDRLGIKTYFASNVCCAYKKNVYDSLGGFTDNAIFNEDMIYEAAAMKAGYMCYYKADAVVIHSHNYSPMQQLRRNFDLGVSQAMHPEVFGGISSEGEGIRMVKATAAHLIKKGRFMDVPKLIADSGFKYVGYRLGKAYKRLPKKLIYKLAMNKMYVKKYLM